MDVQKDAPECIAGSNEDPEAILDEPEADFGQISALAHAINANKGDTIGYTLLGRSQGRGQLCADGKQQIRRRLRSEDVCDRIRQCLPHSRARRYKITSCELWR
jgi:hypothetical protein